MTDRSLENLKQVYPYYVEIPTKFYVIYMNYPKNLFNEINKWCKQNNIDGYVFLNGATYFKIREDAMAFKLVWGC